MQTEVRILIVACCLVFPIVAAAQSVSPDALLLQSRAAQDKALEQASKFYDCTRNYTERNISPGVAAGDLADAAVSKCSGYSGAYISFRTASLLAMLGYSRPQSRGELESRSRQIDEEAKIEGDRLVAHARGLAVREAIELRAIAERAQRRREEPAPPSLAPRKPDV